MADKLDLIAAAKTAFEGKDPHATFARAVRSEVAAARVDGERERQFQGSPVASSRFY